MRAALALGWLLLMLLSAAHAFLIPTTARLAQGWRQGVRRQQGALFRMPSAAPTHLSMARIDMQPIRRAITSPRLAQVWQGVRALGAPLALYQLWATQVRVAG
jgi:hypothetical protein